MPENPPSPRSRRRAWLQACSNPAVWRRAARLGLIVGVIQVSLNQGDHWLRHDISWSLILKSILSPLLSFGIAFVSAAATHVENLQRNSPSA